MQQYYFNTDEYKEGFKAWEMHFKSNFKDNTNNPHQPKTEAWKNWNRGWNLNQKGIN